MAPFGSNTWQTDQVLEETTGFVRTFTLNRPKQLNALSFEMISRLLELFYACKSDPSVKLIILKGKGRAFCAGGDVAAVVRDIHEGNWKSGAELFWKEYTLNYLMATYSKSQVSILNGLVMGGGAGVSVHGRFRIATENSVFAMPETALGLFPDVGASYYLSRLPGFFGEYLGLTGARLDGAEMLACGLATHFVPSEKLSLLEEALHKVDSADPTLISSVINEFSQFPSLKEKSAYNRLDIIDRCFSRGIIEEIISVLESEAVESKDDWISSTIQSLKKASPISLKISLRSIREGRLQGVGQGLVREYRMVCCVVKGEVSKDFSEGCRALLLDKDKNPKWEPSKLELISDNMVERYFSKLDDDDWEDLKLPWRSNLPVSILNGIVMGGGAGVSVHGRFRIATENTVFAMPETALGFFPDIGASYILSRLPGFFGEYLGLTGAKLDGAEIFACGLATTHFVPSENDHKLSLLEETLRKVDSADPTVMSSIINEFSEFLSLKAKSVYNRLDTIDRCFSRRTIEEIITALESEAAETKDDWITLIIQSLKKASPTSLKISLRLIREGRLQGVGQCLVHEYRMVCCVMKGEVSKDFFEGCQAILLD